MVKRVRTRWQRLTWKEIVMMGVIYAVVIGFMFVTLYPFVHIVSVSLSSPAKATRIGMHFYPEELQFQAYRKVLAMNQLGVAYRNTLFMVSVGTIVNLTFTILTAYPLSRRYLLWRGPLIFYFIFTMMFGGGLIPSYLLMHALGLLNSLMGLIIMGAFSVYNMILMKNFLQTIPAALEESAKIDGANDWIVLVRIVLPLSAPVLATIGLFYAVGHWNSFFGNMIYISDSSKIVLQTLLRKLIVTSEASFSSGAVTQATHEAQNQTLAIQDKSAVIVISVVPILMAYPFLQKHFVKGVLIGSVKG